MKFDLRTGEDRRQLRSLIPRFERRRAIRRAMRNQADAAEPPRLEDAGGERRGDSGSYTSPGR